MFLPASFSELDLQIAQQPLGARELADDVGLRLMGRLQPAFERMHADVAADGADAGFVTAIAAFRRREAGELARGGRLGRRCLPRLAPSIDAALAVLPARLLRWDGWRLGDLRFFVHAALPCTSVNRLLISFTAARSPDR